MPSLKLLGRKWGFGADDLVLPSFVCGLFRLVWLILSFFVAIRFSNVINSCNNDNKDDNDHIRIIILKLYISFSIITFFILIILYFIAFIIAKRGTIVQVDKRKQMPCILIIIILFIFVEIMNTSVGTFIIADHASFPSDTFTPCSSSSSSPLFFVDLSNYDQYFKDDEDINERKGDIIINYNDFKNNKILYNNINDDIAELNSDVYFSRLLINVSANDEAWLWLKIIVIGSWIDLILLFECWGFAYLFSTKLEPDFYDTEQGIVIPLLSNPNRRPLEATANVWAGRCQSFCLWFQCATCNLFGGTTGTGGPAAFQDVAIVMASFFKGLDLVPSDIVAALFLLRAKQREDEASAVRAIIRQRIAQEQQPNRLRERRQYPGTGGMFTSVSRWMWSSPGVGARAQSTIHAQQLRASRMARGTSGDIDLEAAKLLDHASYLCPYMLGIYGWMLFSYMHGIKGWCTICANSKNPCCKCLTCCCCCCIETSDAHHEQKRPAIIGNSASENDNCMDLNFLTLKYRTKSANPHADVVYASFTSYSGKAVPYCISVDHVRKKVIIAVRGSLSLADAITDALMTPESLSHHAEKWGFQNDAPEGSYAHAGMLRVASWIRDDIERHQVLHRLTGVKSPPSFNQVPLNRNSISSSSFKKSNHSASKGFSGKSHLAVVLEEDEEEEECDDEENDEPKSKISPLSSENNHVNIKNSSYSNDDNNNDDVVENGSYPRDRTYSMEYDALPECSGYDIELVGHSLGAGVASILSLFLRPIFPSLKCTAFSPPGCIFDWKLANHSATWINSLFVGKDFAARCSWYSLVKIRGQILDVLRRAKVGKGGAYMAGIIERDIDDILYQENEVPDTPQTRALMQRIDELATTTIGRSSTTLDQVRMYIPGRVLHLIKEETTTWGGCGPCRREKRRYAPCWIDDRSTLDEIILSSRMALDHFPDYIDHVIRDIVDEYKIQQPKE